MSGWLGRPSSRWVVLVGLGCRTVDERAAAVTPDAPIQGRDALSCGVPDGVDVTWRVDGRDVDDVGRTLPAERTRQGRRWSCHGSDGRSVWTGSTEVRPLGGNVLLFVLDDIGVDRIGSYGAHANPVHTPAIDGLAAAGVRFERAWATPMCSPTRAALMTGRLPGRTGIGHVLDLDVDAFVMGEDEVCVPEVLANADPPVTSALVGKWHLGGRSLGAAGHPRRACGFALHDGPLENLQVSATGQPPIPRGYTRWEQDAQGVLVERTGYATLDQVETAVARVQELPEPWFVMVSFSGAHIPLHRPPDWAVYTVPEDDAPASLHRAMVESVDHALGAVVEQLAPDVAARTTIVVLGDNGTVPTVVDPPLPYAKGTVAEAGIRVPLVVAGAAVRRPGVSGALVHAVDLFDTLAAIAGVDPEDVDPGVPRDGRSLLPFLGDPDAPSAREVLTTEWYVPNGASTRETWQLAATDGRYKLMLAEGQELPDLPDIQWMVDLQADPTEQQDLLSAPLEPEAEAALERLEAALAGGITPYGR